MSPQRRLTGFAFLTLGVLGGIAVVGAFAGLTLLTIAEHADTNLAHLDDEIARFFGAADAA